MDMLAAEGAEQNITVQNPLGDNEIQTLETLIEEGDIDSVLSGLANMEHLGHWREAAMTQLEQTNGRLGYIGSMVSQGEIAAARNALAGYQMLQQNPDVTRAMLTRNADVGWAGSANVFSDMIGSSLLSTMGQTADVAQELTDGVFVQKLSRVATSVEEFVEKGGDPNELYQEAAEEILGGEIFDDGFSPPVVLPPNVNEDQWERFQMNMGPSNYTMLSPTGQTPVFDDEKRTVVPEEWFDEEAYWHMAGPNMYAFTDAVGNVLGGDDGNPFIIELNAEKINAVIGGFE
jgi:hypothetical protein